MASLGSTKGAWGSMRAIRSMAGSIAGKLLRRLGLEKETGRAGFKSHAEWLQLVSVLNRRQLDDPVCDEIWAALVASPSLGTIVRPRLWLTRSSTEHEYTWKIALNTLGAEWVHRVTGAPEELASLRSFFQRILDDSGHWITPTNRVDYAMKGYSLLYLAQATGAALYRIAAQQLVDSLLAEHPTASDGSLVYETISHSVLVDTLAMICPFLARYSSLYGNTEAMRVSTNQLLQFVRINVDADTCLPYHGYYSDGPRRLGMHGWGRGTGWYVLGLIDTIAELPRTHPDRLELTEAYVRAAHALRDFQRPDGHWNWAIPHRADGYDSSTTSLVGYSLIRGLQIGVLDSSFLQTISAALRALVHVTHANGILDGALVECWGLGQYPQCYGPRPWLQGATTAFAALYLWGINEGLLAWDENSYGPR